MQIQSPSFSYQSPQTYGFSNNTMQMTQPSQAQSTFAPQSQSDQTMNLLMNVLMRVLDFAFNLITQLCGQNQGASPQSGIGFRSAAAPAAESASLWDMGKDLFDSVASSLGITKLVGTVVDGAKSIFSGGLFKSAAKIGGAIASIF
jgi:hypothetical protein